MANLEHSDTTALAADTPVLSGNGDYTEANIQHLQNADHIRKRPGNYIPDTGTRGLHHLIYELVYNSVDEALVGHCNNINITIGIDGNITVADDGRGIPVEIHPIAKKPTLELVLTALGTSGKFDDKAYRVAVGLHGIGAKAVTALSEWAEARIRRNGRTYLQEYERGYATTPVKDIGAADRTGTTITFRPDPEIFDDVNVSYETVSERLRELAFLNRGLNISLHDERINKKETFHYEGGVAEFVTWLNRNEEVLHEPIYVHKTVDIEKTINDEPVVHTIDVETAIQYTIGDAERVRCYANNGYNPAGGTHLSGFRRAVTATLNAYGEKNNLFKGDLKPIGDDYRQGLTAVVNVQLPDPQFESQTKVRLNNPEVEGAVSSAVSEVLGQYLEENPKAAQQIIRKVMLTAEAREAAAKAREAIRKRKNILSGGGLPGKLMDCTSKGDDSELFLVEGDSAGGSAESGRDRQYQAVLPLRGKPLNVEKAMFEKLLKNDEITSIISAVGIDIGNPEDISKIRYGKIIIMTDADVDGQHIRTLLLTFFFRQMRKLIEEGYIYIARPPLYKVAQKKNIRFVQTVEEMLRELMDRGRTGTILLITPPEGEARELQDDELTPLLKVLEEIERNLITLERRGDNLAMLVPHLKESGLPMYRVRFETKEYWFHDTDEVEEFRQTESERLGRELVVDESEEASHDAAHFQLQELHEIRGINRGLAKLQEFGFGVEDLLPLPRVAGREPPIRYTLIHGETKRPLPHLRDLVPEIRRLGEKGLSITRFKGLGEMDPEELWDTTLDPEHRSLMRVSLTDAQKADELFRKLMGDEVEGRRQFIFDHGINLQDIDYGA